ncbi:MAG: hypothetical protein HQL25_03975 [Candidatus Omnitrophica bacterium]|nr:hypothetical protein [Candidatus Omnitrophota bacterium]
MAHQQNFFINRGVLFIVLVTFFVTNIMPVSYAQTVMPVIGHELSCPYKSTVFTPVLIKGVTVYPKEPLRFNFIVDSGTSKDADDAIKKQAQKMVNYFLAALTVPQKDLWVNLSPNEPDRIIPQELSKTNLGVDLLAQDYLLKQLTASLLDPDGEAGRKFWEAIYAKVYALHLPPNKSTGVGKGREGGKDFDIPADIFNKVWIVPESATIYENGNGSTSSPGATVYIVESRLKVMTDVDYSEHLPPNKSTGVGKGRVGGITADIIKQIILPEIEREVNEGEGFAQLRQIYHALILAKWYKETVRNSILSQVYVDKNKTSGAGNVDPRAKEQIYQEYLAAFKKGAFAKIKEEYDPQEQKIIPRKYFSGGFTDDGQMKMKLADQAALTKIHTGRTFQMPVKLNPETDRASLAEEKDCKEALKWKRAVPGIKFWTADQIVQKSKEALKRKPVNLGFLEASILMLDEEDKRRVLREMPKYGHDLILTGRMLDLASRRTMFDDDQKYRFFKSFLVFDEMWSKVKSIKGMTGRFEFLFPKSVKYYAHNYDGIKSADKFLAIAKKIKLWGHGFGNFHMSEAAYHGGYTLDHQWAMLEVMLTRWERGAFEVFKDFGSFLSTEGYGPYFMIDRNHSRKNVSLEQLNQEALFVVPLGLDLEFFRQGLLVAVEKNLISREKAVDVYTRIVTMKEVVDYETKADARAMFTPEWHSKRNIDKPVKVNSKIDRAMIIDDEDMIHLQEKYKRMTALVKVFGEYLPETYTGQKIRVAELLYKMEKEMPELIKKLSMSADLKGEIYARLDAIIDFMRSIVGTSLGNDYRSLHLTAVVFIDTYADFKAILDYDYLSKKDIELMDLSVKKIERILDEFIKMHDQDDGIEHYIKGYKKLFIESISAMKQNSRDKTNIRFIKDALITLKQGLFIFSYPEHFEIKTEDDPKSLTDWARKFLANFSKLGGKAMRSFHNLSVLALYILGNRGENLSELIEQARITNEKFLVEYDRIAQILSGIGVSFPKEQTDEAMSSDEQKAAIKRREKNIEQKIKDFIKDKPQGVKTWGVPMGHFLLDSIHSSEILRALMFTAAEQNLYEIALEYKESLNGYEGMINAFVIQGEEIPRMERSRSLVEWAKQFRRNYWSLPNDKRKGFASLSALSLLILGGSETYLPEICRRMGVLLKDIKKEHQEIFKILAEVDPSLNDNTASAAMLSEDQKQEIEDITSFIRQVGSDFQLDVPAGVDPNVWDTTASHLVLGRVAILNDAVSAFLYHKPSKYVEDVKYLKEAISNLKLVLAPWHNYEQLTIKTSDDPISLNEWAEKFLIHFNNLNFKKQKSFKSLEKMAKLISKGGGEYLPQISERMKHLEISIETKCQRVFVILAQVDPSVKDVLKDQALLSGEKNLAEAQKWNRPFWSLDEIKGKIQNELAQGKPFNAFFMEASIVMLSIEDKHDLYAFLEKNYEIPNYYYIRLKSLSSGFGQYHVFDATLLYDNLRQEMGDSEMFSFPAEKEKRSPQEEAFLWKSDYLYGHGMDNNEVTGMGIYVTGQTPYNLRNQWAMLQIMMRGFGKGEVGEFNSFTHGLVYPGNYGPYYVIAGSPQTIINGGGLYVVPDAQSLEFIRRGLLMAVTKGFITVEKAAHEFSRVSTMDDIIEAPDFRGKLHNGTWQNSRNIDEPVKAPGKDPTQTVDQDVGGIDMNDIKLGRWGDSPSIQFDPKAMQELLYLNPQRFSAVVIDFIPVQNVLGLLGIK